ncbi:MAG: 2,3-bisphosphoglycerate-dependent phosphoglycerate mutase, partial [Pyramidobacter sp.]
MKNLKRLLGALALLAVLAASAWAAPKNVTLVLLRHGESEWNLEDRFTGWSDVCLTRKGVKGAFNAGIAMKNADLTFDVVHTSLLSRAIATAWLAMSALDCRWLPVEKFWRLNERCYGDLEGKTRTEVAEAVGKEQVDIWRRSYDVPPPALAYE